MTTLEFELNSFTENNERKIFDMNNEKIVEYQREMRDSLAITFMPDGVRKTLLAFCDKETCRIAKYTLAACKEAELSDSEAFDMLTSSLDAAEVEYIVKDGDEIVEQLNELYALNERFHEEFKFAPAKVTAIISKEADVDTEFGWRFGTVNAGGFKNPKDAYDDLVAYFTTPHVKPLMGLFDAEDFIIRFFNVGSIALHLRKKFCDEPDLKTLKTFYNDTTGRVLLAVVCDEDKMLERAVTAEETAAVEEAVSAIEFIARKVNGLPIVPDGMDEDIDDVPLSGCMPS